MTSVLLVDPRADAYEAQLRRAFPDLELTAAPAYPDDDAVLVEAQVLLTMGVRLPGVHFTRDVADRMPALEWVQCLVSGSEHVREALTGRDVLITNMAGIHGPQMSEMALLHMLALSRNLPRLARNQAEHVWERVPQRILEGKVAGILGVGAVGAHLATTLASLGMRVVTFSRQPRPLPGVERTLLRDELLFAAPDLDFLVCLLPAGDDTRHFVDAEVFLAMKPSAYLVSLSRGSVVDEAALVDALRSGEIAGAGLDVFETEPLPVDNPLWELDNAIVTPHLGGHHDRSVEQSLSVLEPNLRAFLAGRRDEMINVVSS